MLNFLFCITIMTKPLILILSLAYACYFINDLLIKNYAPKLNTVFLIKLRTFFSVSFAVVWLIISGDWIAIPTAITFIQIIAISIVCGAGLFLFIKANQHLSFPNVIAINLLGLITQQIIAYLFLQEDSKKSYPISILLIIVGLLILASVPKLKKGIIYALLSTLFWSVGYALLSVPLKHTTAGWGSFIMETVILISVLLGSKYLDQKKGRTILSLSSKGSFFLMGLLTISGSILFNYAYQNYQVSEVSLLYMLFYPSSILVSKLYFREKLELKEWLGNVFIICGVVYFQLF